MDVNRVRFDELKKMYSEKELADCFASLHMTIDRKISDLKQEIKVTNEKVAVLESNAHLVNDQIRGIQKNIVPNLEDKISDESKERISLELWERKRNLVIGGIAGTMNETPPVI